MSGRFQPLYDETAPAIVPPPEPNALAPPPTWADAATLAGQEIARQRQISADRGLWDQGGMTRAGVTDAAGQLTNMLATSTSAPGFRAYHGSPHSFEKFDTSKIGTGEGAQAYGHGLYVAESENVAKSYRDQLSRTDYTTTTGKRIPDWIGTSIKQVGDQFGHDSKLHGQIIDRHIGDFEARLADEQSRMKTAVDPWNSEDRIANFNTIIGGLKELRSGEATLKPRGSMYEVNVNADPAHFLDWDKPLHEQSPHVQEALSKILGRDVSEVPTSPFTGRPLTGPFNAGGAYEHVVANFGLRREGADIKASEALREAGIPGIRYLDAGSRASGDTSNHVIFDANTIEILRKYGIAGLLAGGTAAATASRQEPPT